MGVLNEEFLDSSEKAMHDVSDELRSFGEKGLLDDATL